jgi:hypothetical protein
MPKLPNAFVRSVPLIWMAMNNVPNHRTFASEIGDVSVRVPGTVSSIM